VTGVNKGRGNEEGSEKEVGISSRTDGVVQDDLQERQSSSGPNTRKI
jgi:hypothetical protein